MKGLFMTPIFPRLPKGLTTNELKAEISRRMAVLVSLGLIKYPKKSKNVVCS
jgi:hypothetical protein